MKCVCVLMVVLLATWLCSCCTSMIVYTVAYNTLLCLTLDFIPNVYSVLLNTNK